MRYVRRFAALTIALAMIVAASLFWPGPETDTAPTTGADPQPVRILLAAVGDLLMHMPVVNSAYDRDTGGYDFSGMFAPVTSYLSCADYTIANLETRLAGPAGGYHGYPLFNTPAELARDLREAGIDLLATANNHSLDMGWDGIVKTLHNIEAAGLAHVGTYRAPSEKATPFIADVRGIKLAFLNYTATTNGLPIPPGKEFAVNLLDPATVIAEADAARKLGADLVVAVLPFGLEYQRQPGEDQRRLAHELCASGVDVIIGSHPHVVQPIERVTVQRGGQPYTCVIAYSLGNFISNQRWRYSDSGIILYLDIEKTDEGTFVRGVSYLPVWVQKRMNGTRCEYRVLPVHPDVSSAARNQLLPEEQRRLAEVWEEVTTHLSNPAAGILPYGTPAATDCQDGRSPVKYETFYKSRDNGRPGISQPAAPRPASYGRCTGMGWEQPGAGGTR